VPPPLYPPHTLLSLCLISLSLSQKQEEKKRERKERDGEKEGRGERREGREKRERGEGGREGRERRERGERERGKKREGSERERGREIKERERESKGVRGREMEAKRDGRTGEKSEKEGGGSLRDSIEKNTEGLKEYKHFNWKCAAQLVGARPQIERGRHLAKEGGIGDGVSLGALKGAGAPAGSLVHGLEGHGGVVSGVVVGLVALGFPPEANAVALGAFLVLGQEAEAGEAAVVEGADVLQIRRRSTSQSIFLQPTFDSPGLRAKSPVGRASGRSVPPASTQATLLATLTERRSQNVLASMVTCKDCSLNQLLFTTRAPGTC
jgi:hypothetical protein